MNQNQPRPNSVFAPTRRSPAKLILKCLALWLGCATTPLMAQSWVAGSPPNDAIATTYFPYLATTIANVAYGSGSSQVGDIWLPNYNGKPVPGNSTSRPAVIVVHGGGGTSGSRNSTRELQISGFCAAHGYVAFNIDYPIGAVYPQNIQSWRLAARFLRANAATYGIDPNHIGITGGSFGGYCSAFMCGITNGQHTLWTDSNAKYNNASLDLDSANDLSAYSGSIQCGIDLYGPTDQVTSGNAAGQYSSPTQTTLSNSSPVYYVHATSVPLMIAHGTADTTVSISQSQEMTNYLGRFNVPNQFCVVQGAAHTFYYYSTTQGHWPPGNSVLDLRQTAFDWFDKYLLAAANPPFISVQPTPQSGCSGYSASFSVTASGTAPLAYQWSGPSGVIANATNATYTIASLAGGNAGNYFVVITNGFGGVTSSVVALTVTTLNPPAITTQPTNTSVLAGSAASLAVGATGDALKYQWYGPNGAIANATNATYNIGSAANTDAGTYQVVVYNACNSLVSSNASLTVNGPPAITGQPISVVTCTGTSASIAASANGTAPLSYQWYGIINGVVSGATSNTLNLSNLTVANSDNYYLVVTNAFGSATSSNAQLTVSANSNVTVTSQPVNTEVAVGGAATFSVSVSGGGPYTYLWLKNDYDTITNVVATNATLVFPSVQASDAAYYHCYINNDCYTAGTTNATLTVDVGPTILQSPQNSTNNVNATVTLSVFASGTAPLTYQWRTNSVNLANATNSTLVFNSIQPYNAGAYDVVVANAFGSVTSSVANVTVNSSTSGSVVAYAAASVQGSTNANNDIDEQSLGYVKVKYSTTANSSGMAKGYYGFDLTGQNPDTTKPATLNIPCVSGSGATHIQLWGLLQAYSTMNNNLTWNTAQANDTNFTANGLLTSGTYTAAMIGSNTACAAGAVTNVITLPANWGQFLINNKIVLVLTPANPTGDSSSGFRPNATNAYLPALAFSVAGSVTTPSISSQPSSQAVCSTTPVNFTVVAGGALPLSYQWQFGGVNIDPGVNATATNATLSLTGTSPANNGSYQVIITNVYGGVTSSVATLTVSADPAVNITGQPANTSAVLGGSASFTVTASGGTLTYQWYQGSSPVSGGTSATLTLNNLAATNAGSYTCTINNSCGSAISQAATLTINTPPTITQQPANQSVFAGGTANFSVTATGSTPLSYQWRRGGTPINGATGSTYSLGPVSTGDSGSTFDVVITNSFGSITSSPAATLTVTPVTTSGTVVIDEVYAGGGKTGAAYSHDYVVLKNVSSSSVSLNGWSLQHDKVGVWQTPFALPNATIPPGGYFLIQCYNDGGTAAGANLPTPDATATQSSVWNMSYASADAVALVSNTTPLTSCSSASVVDLVGAGTVTGNCYLGTGITPTGASATMAMSRLGGGCQNSGDNTIDFVAAPASPKNSATTASPCITYTQFLPGYDAGYNNFGGGENLILTNTSGLNLYVWSSTDLSVSVTNWTLVGPMLETPFGATGWSRYGINLDPAVSPTYYIFAPTNSGPYTPTEPFATVTGNDNDGFVVTGLLYPISAAGIFQFGTPPAITNQPSAVAVIAGNTASFTVGVTGDAPLSYQWYFNATTPVGLNTNVLTLNNVQAANVGNYSVIVTNNSGSVTSTPAALTVQFPPVITNQPVGLSVLAGQQAGFNVGATGSGLLSYQWFYNNNSISVAPTSGLNLGTVSAANAGPYFVLITNAYGSATSSVANLAVAPPPAFIVGLVSPGTIGFNGTTITGLNYVVQSAANLSPPVTWTSVQTNNTGATGAINFQTNTATGPPTFYRLWFP